MAINCINLNEVIITKLKYKHLHMYTTQTYKESEASD